MFKNLNRYFRKRFDRLYRKRRWHLFLDISLIVVILILAVAILSLHFYNPKINDFNSWTKPNGNSEEIIKITEPPIEASFTWENKTIKQAETAKISVTIKNTAAIAISDYKLIFSSRDNNFLVSGILAFPDLAANSEKTFPLEINIKPTSAISEKLVNVRAEQNYQASNQVFKDSYDLPAIKVVSNLTISAAAYYNSPQGDQLGSGPLPPVVGLPTNFWIFLKAESDGNFSNFSLSAKLPKNVKLTENSSLLAGDLNYNEAARQIVWRIEKVETGSSEYRAGFEIQIIPEENQVGSLAMLLNQIRYQGEDIFTGSKIEGSISGVDTGLEADVLNRGEGTVISLDEELSE